MKGEVPMAVACLWDGTACRDSLVCAGKVCIARGGGCDIDAGPVTPAKMLSAVCVLNLLQQCLLGTDESLTVL
jgi:hypothetical protein